MPPFKARSNSWFSAALGCSAPAFICFLAPRAAAAARGHDPLTRASPFLRALCVAARLPSRRVTRVGKRGTTPQAPNHCRGAAKTQQCHKYFLQHSIFASERPQVRTWGRQTCFLPRAPSNLVTPLLERHHGGLGRSREVSAAVTATLEKNVNQFPARENCRGVSQNCTRDISLRMVRRQRFKPISMRACLTPKQTRAQRSEMQTWLCVVLFKFYLFSSRAATCRHQERERDVRLHSEEAKLHGSLPELPVSAAPLHASALYVLFFLKKAGFVLVTVKQMAVFFS